MSHTSDDGKRFSHAYLSRGKPTSDSPRLRKRIATFVAEIPYEYDLGTTLQMELGVAWSGWHSFYSKCEVKDLLDSLTVIHHELDRRGGEARRRNSPQEWIALINRIFREENVHYMMGKLGGVHFAQDAEFSHNISATVASLQSARYKNILAEFSQIQGALDETPPNGKEAIRKAFTATEGLFRLMYPDAPRLGAAEAKSRLSPLLAKTYAAHVADQRAATKMLAAFADWIDAAHFYRHEHGREEIAQPDIGLAINMVSVSAAHLRWLTELDTKATE